MVRARPIKCGSRLDIANEAVCFKNVGRTLSSVGTAINVGMIPLQTCPVSGLNHKVGSIHRYAKRAIWIE